MNLMFACCSIFLERSIKLYDFIVSYSILLFLFFSLGLHMKYDFYTSLSDI